MDALTTSSSDRGAETRGGTGDADGRSRAGQPRDDAQDRGQDQRSWFAPARPTSGESASPSGTDQAPERQALARRPPTPMDPAGPRPAEPPETGVVPGD